MDVEVLVKKNLDKMAVMSETYLCEKRQKAEDERAKLTKQKLDISIQQLNHDKWSARMREKDVIKTKKDAIIDKYVNAKISGNIQDAKKYSKELAQISDIPKNSKELELQSAGFKKDRILFLEGVLQFSNEGAVKFYENLVAKS